MKILVRLSVAAALIILFSSWGFLRTTALTGWLFLPYQKAWRAFYKANINFITEHAVDPDKRRYVDSLEAPHHFLNADHYGKVPFGRIPQNWYDAVKKYSVDTLNKYGTLPWAIQTNYFWLVKAFKAHDTTAILKASCDIGHYIADAHVPLHLATNYDGQLTNQTGLHSFWESRLPELFSDKYNLYVGKAKYINDPLAEAFAICKSSFKCVDSVLLLERKLNATYPPDKKYEMDKRNSRQVKNYSRAYSAAYHKLLNGMVKRRMRSAILEAGSFWYSAWIDAGQPNLDKLIITPLTAEQKQAVAKEEALYKAKN